MHLPNLHAIGIILATPTERLREFNHYLNRTSSEPWVPLLFWLLTLGVATTLLILGMRYARFSRWDRSLGHPWRLFYRTMWRLPLSWRQRCRLAQLARVACPESPLAVVLTPSGFARAVRMWAGGRPRADERLLDQRFGPISRALFGDDMDT